MFKNLKYKYTVLLVLLLSALSACEKDVVLDLAEKQGRYLIVEANIADDGSRQWIKLSRSSSYYDVSQDIWVTGAIVSVSDGEHEYVFFEMEQDSLAGYYFNDEISKELKDRNYTLFIEESDGNTYTAQSKWLPVPLLDSVSVKLNPFSALGFTDQLLYDVFGHFKNEEFSDRFYLFNLYLNHELYTLSPRQKTTISNENLNDYVSLAVLNLPEEDLVKGDTVTLEIRSISLEQHEFYNAFFFQTDLSGNPFAGGPSSNIPTNLSEGARGFFQVSSLSRNSKIFE